MQHAKRALFANLGFRVICMFSFHLIHDSYFLGQTSPKLGVPVNAVVICKITEPREKKQEKVEFILKNFFLNFTWVLKYFKLKFVPFSKNSTLRKI